MTSIRASGQTLDLPGDDMDDDQPQPQSQMQTCPSCQQQVVPVMCGEKVGDTVCTDLLCPVCGEELPA